MKFTEFIPPKHGHMYSGYDYYYNALDQKLIAQADYASIILGS